MEFQRMDKVSIRHIHQLRRGSYLLHEQVHQY
jgi:hypothetical protein